ncbi:MAG: hypothetical protein JNL05_10505 [Flavobacteriales bacterium]|nr:hypothetical protein [Flavobacteriales bacterium]
MPIRGLDNVQRKVDRLRKALDQRIPKLVQADAIRFFRSNFKAQGWQDGGVRKWAPVKNKKLRKGSVLKRTGALMNSIRAGRASWNGIQVLAGGPGVPYAQAHNEGITLRRQVTIRAHTRRGGPVRTRRGRVMRKEATVGRHQRRMNLHLRRRQFMGQSRDLNILFRKTILTEIGKVMNTR